MASEKTIKVAERQLECAALDSGCSAAQARTIWQRLQSDSQAESQFEPAHVGYFFGALLVIGAMGWFITDGWDSFKGWQLASIAAGYAVIFVLVGRPLWRTPLFRVPGGLLVTMAVCMAPLVIYGLERQFGLWPAEDPGSYTRFHPYIKASWVFMELGTILACLVALRYIKFPFLTAPATYALWYFSMDATALIFGRDWRWQDECIISAVLGAILLLVSYYVDGKTTADFSYWGYLFGLLMFTGGLSGMESGSELGKFGYFLAHLALVVVSILLHRRVFLIFGALGVFGYLCNEAYTYFRYSVAFPFVLTLIGIAVIFAAMQYKKREQVLEAKIRRWLSRDVREFAKSKEAGS